MTHQKHTLTVMCSYFLPARFSPAQAELYEAVLEVQRSCLSLCSPGVSLDHIYSTMLALLGRQLRQLGIVKAGTSDADVLKVKIEAEQVPAGRSCLCFITYEDSFIENNKASCTATCLRLYFTLLITWNKNDVHTQTHSILCFNIANVNLSLALP